ncbi:hypothetical protein QAD02_016521 [Eretmocerus hayati]|uniref:Uncharacterized protein n=1 Tax=Eretmocerus hayati TaxID=131215 RepID=A0ACC2PDU8_9HYME|nr:hypothetical protein QAD02_016521 [Eretmocerus hayati]
MGVLGLWRLIDASGKPVPLETLEGKVLAIDISIWIHQVLQGYQDRRGNAVPNAHLIGLFNRICKLMYFKIKPVFVFDGGVPLLKKNTIATRRKLKSIAASKAQKLKNDLINNLIKHAAVKGVLDKDDGSGESSTVQKLKNSALATDSSRDPDIYKLPNPLTSSLITDSENYIDSEEEEKTKHSPRKQTKWAGNIHSVELNTDEFKNLPADVRYDILTDLKETRKQNSWGRLHELPTGSDDYAGFQMKRLLKRRFVQESLEAAEKEMGGKSMTLEELDQLLTEQGINTTQKDDAAYRIASDSTTRVVYIKDKPDAKSIPDTSATKNGEKSDKGDDSNDAKSKEIETLSDGDSEDLLSINSENSVRIIDNINEYQLDIDEDWLSDEGFADTTLSNSPVLPKTNIPKSVMNPALAYMLENSGLTRDAVMKIVEQTKKNKEKSEDIAEEMPKQVKRTRTRLSQFQANKKRKLDSSATKVTKVRDKVSCSDDIPSNSRSLPKHEDSTLAFQVPEIKIEKEQADEPDKTITMNSSDSDADDFIEIPDVPVPELPSKNVSKVVPQTKKPVIPDQNSNVNSSDTDSDDFVEIPNVPLPPSSHKSKVGGKALEILIKADEKLEDDIFADVFIDNKNVEKKEEFIKDEKKSDFIENQITIKETKKVDEAKESIKDETSINKIADQINVEDVFLKDLILKEVLAQVKAEKEKLLRVDEERQKNISPSDYDKIEQKICDELPITSCEGVEFDSQSVGSISSEKSPIHQHDLEIVNQQDSLDMNIDKNFEKDLVENATVESNDKDVAEAAEIIEDVDFTEPYNLESEERIEKDKVIEKPALVLPENEEELESMKKQLETEQQQIAGNLGKLERQAVDITDQMRLEAQELLRLFGVPYLVAPMEAEAQCAFLEQAGLTDGTVTDDSDIWLFGGRCVYKNFFDNNKRVLQYLSKDIEHHFRLTRKEMILLALLVGSDYTNGLTGVGPVTALEILASFPTEGEDILRGLRSFSQWLRAGQLAAPGKSTLRTKLKNIQVEKGFPSQAVVQAYLSPMVNESKEAFTWGKPSLTLLADYVRQKFGWTRLKFDEIMNPVMKRFTEVKSQKDITAYFKVHTVPKSIEAVLSKRVQTALHKMSGKIQDEEVSDGESPAVTAKGKAKKPRKAPVKGKKKSKNNPETSSAPETNEGEGEKSSTQNDDEKSKTESVDNEEIAEPVSVTSPGIAGKTRSRKLITLPDPDANIPQRERDKVNALKSKLKAIEIFRKSKKGLGKVTKAKKVVKKIKDDAELSESSDSS